MQYRRYIEDRFMVDDPRTGQLVPFVFRPLQNRYYDQLVRDYDIEKNGLAVPIREDILKARRQGFSAFILALFAADDLMSDNPTESLSISYRDDATSTFRKRYRNYILTAAARMKGMDPREIQANVNVLEQFAKQAFSVDSTELELRENKARFYCGTASARVGGRGGVVQKLHFSEAAFYPDKKEMKAKEIIEGTLRQVDVSSGWAFVESTANGDNNHYARMWKEAEGGTSRFKPRFFGWREFYTEDEFALIKSEFTDKRMIPQEYPETAAEAFLSSGDRFFDPTIIQLLKTEEPRVEGSLCLYDNYHPGHRYALGADVSEGVGRHSSTVAVIDFDAQSIHDGKIYKKPKVVAVYANNKIAPDLFGHEIASIGNRFGSCIVAPERNNHGFACLVTLKDRYFNIYKDEQEKLGWHTNLASKPRMMHELRTALHEGLIEIPDKALRTEVIGYPQTDLNTPNVDELDETGGHYDRVIALAIAWQMRSLAVPSMSHQHYDEEWQKFQPEGEFDRHNPFAIV